MNARRSTPTDALWTCYRATRDPAARRALLDHYLGLVHHQAREIVRRTPNAIELDDLVGAGTLGLVQALEGFDPSRGLAFSTYAVPRIRGAILDDLRAREWAPRTVRTRRRQLADTRAALQHRLGRVPDEGEIAAALGIDLDTYWRWIGETGRRVMVALDQVGTQGVSAGLRLEETIPEPVSTEPGLELARDQSLAAMREAFGALPPRERLVLALYYYESLTLKQIGEVLHVTESRVSQIRTHAFRRLREILAREEAA